MMLALRERLQGVVDILNASNDDMEYEPQSAQGTGFIAVPPAVLADAVVALMQHAKMTDVSLDLGCGTGNWMLLCAAAGFASYGVELNPVLVSHAQRNYERAVAAGFIDAATPCMWTVGDMVPVRFSSAYAAFRKRFFAQERTMPTGAVVEDSYERLPVNVATADIIYCWAWPTQSRFIFNMLEEEAKDGALFVLPSYEQYMAGDGVSQVEIPNTLVLTPVAVVGSVYVGRRAA